MKVQGQRVNGWRESLTSYQEIHKPKIPYPFLLCVGRYDHWLARQYLVVLLRRLLLYHRQNHQGLEVDFDEVSAAAFPV
jgi:hypothetical protein